MLSRFSRRSLPMIVRVGKRVVSTQTYAQVQALERVFENLHWKDAKDKVEEIREIMDEYKTNHSVATPDAKFEQMVTEKLHEIEEMAGQVGSEHKQVFHEVFGLEDEVKSELYPHEPYSCG